MESKINVTLRVKPLSAAEAKLDKNKLWTKVSDNTLMNTRSKDVFSFDKVFDQNVSTDTIFKEQVKDLVHNSLNGFNQTIFAYGQTSSGKTFTMHGDKKNNKGLIPLSIAEIFDFIKNDAQRCYKVSVSYMEVSVRILRNLNFNS